MPQKSSTLDRELLGGLRTRTRLRGLAMILPASGFTGSIAAATASADAGTGTTMDPQTYTSMTASATSSSGSGSTNNPSTIFTSSSLLFGLVFMAILVVFMACGFIWQRSIFGPRRNADTEVGGESEGGDNTNGMEDFDGEGRTNGGMINVLNPTRFSNMSEKEIQARMPKIWDVYVEDKIKDPGVVSKGWEGIFPLSSTILRPPLSHSSTPRTRISNGYIPSTLSSPGGSSWIPVVPSVNFTDVKNTSSSTDHRSSSSSSLRSTKSVQVSVMIAMPVPPVRPSLGHSYSKSDTGYVASTSSTLENVSAKDFKHDNGDDDDIVYEIGVADLEVEDDPTLFPPPSVAQPKSSKLKGFSNARNPGVGPVTVHSNIPETPLNTSSASRRPTSSVLIMANTINSMYGYTMASAEMNHERESGSANMFMTL